MKKFYAIVLALALLLGYASIASADFAISGQFETSAVYDTNAVAPAPEWIGLKYDGDTRLELKLSGTYEDVSGDLKLRFKDAGSVVVRTGNFFYKLSDELSLGVSYDMTGDLQVYESMVDSEFDWQYNLEGDFLDAADGDPVFIAKIALGDLTASIATDLTGNVDEVLWLYAGGTYNLDPITIGCGIEVYDDCVVVMPGVKYAFSDELSVDGELLYEVESEYTLIGAGVNYATDALSLEAGVWADLSDTATEDIAYYFLYASYSVTDNVDLYMNYFSKDATFNPAEYDEGYEIGATIYLDSNDKSCIDINYMEVDEDLTFTFRLKF